MQNGSYIVTIDTSQIVLAVLLMVRAYIIQYIGYE